MVWNDMKFACALGNAMPTQDMFGGQSAANDVVPPLYGTSDVSPVLSKCVIEIGRAGLQPMHDGLCVEPPVTHRKSTGAPAAIMSARSHATLYVMPPPFEQPVA